MKNIYTWIIHDEYAKYWTKESLESSEEFDELFDKAEVHLARTFNPNDLENWNPPIMKEEVDDNNKFGLQGDFHSTWGGFDGHLLSQNMVDKIGDILLEYGNLFPLEVEDREDNLYRYWVTKEISFECVDKNKSKFFDDEYSEDYVFKIEKPVSNEDYSDIPMIFRISEEYSKTIFVTEEFIELIKKKDLKGFKFIHDTSYENANKSESYILVG